MNPHGIPPGSVGQATLPRQRVPLLPRIDKQVARHGQLRDVPVNSPALERLVGMFDNNHHIQMISRAYWMASPLCNGP